MTLPFIDRAPAAVPVAVVAPSEWAAWFKRQPAKARTWLQAASIAGKAGDFAMVPDGDGKPSMAVVVRSAKPTMWDYGALATRLPPGDYALVGESAPSSVTEAAIAFALGS